MERNWLCAGYGAVIEVDAIDETNAAPSERPSHFEVVLPPDGLIVTSEDSEDEIPVEMLGNVHGRQKAILIEHQV